MHCTWVYNNEFFIIKWSHIIHMTNFVNKIDKKYIWRGQFHQFKNPRWLFCKIKTPGGLFATEPNPRR